MRALLVALAVVGLALLACGRYGPPDRHPPEERTSAVQAQYGPSAGPADPVCEEPGKDGDEETTP